MPRSSRVTFFNKDTELCTASTTPCPVCYETTTSSSALGSLRTRVRNTKTIAKMLISGCHKDSGTVKLRTKPSRSNCTVRIKECGHEFCYDCLETWVQRNNTCPMCRNQLFFDAKGDKDSDDMTEEEMEQWMALSEDRHMGNLNNAAIRGSLGDEGNYEGGDEMQGNADEKAMRTRRQCILGGAVIGQRPC